MEDELIARARARIGATLKEKYRLVSLLGVGGMAAVYSAIHLRNANRVALKILHRELSVDGFLRTRFLREGYAANKVDHPGAVRVLDDDQAEDGSVFLVMELLEGETLEKRCSRCGGKLAAAEVTSLMRSLLAVLGAAHAHGIVHRDVKPENVFVTRDGQVKVLDFGLARVHESFPTVTRAGAVFGTPAFMPPEQALGRVREVDALSDVWAVGATAFWLLSGRYVHNAESVQETLVLSATQPAPPLRDVAPDVPTSLAGVIDRALAQKKSDRWQSAKEMQQALNVAQHEELKKSKTPSHVEGEYTDVSAPPPMSLGGHDETTHGAAEAMTELAPPVDGHAAAAHTVAGIESRRDHDSPQAGTRRKLLVGLLAATVAVVGVVSVAAFRRAPQASPEMMQTGAPPALPLAALSPSPSTMPSVSGAPEAPPPPIVSVPRATPSPPEPAVPRRPPSPRSPPAPSAKRDPLAP